MAAAVGGEFGDIQIDVRDCAECVSDPTAHTIHTRIGSDVINCYAKIMYAVRRLVRIVEVNPMCAK